MNDKYKNLNRLSKMVVSLRKWPKSWRHGLLNFLIHHTVKFTGTAKINVELLDFNRSVMTIKNRKKVQNHIGSVHATAMALLAETATGLIVGMNIPDTSIPLLKSMKINYLKKAVGDLRAEATLQPDQISQMRTTDKGDFMVAVQVTDAEGKQPIECFMIWAWTAKRK